MTAHDTAGLLARAQRRLAAHDLLLRALLTHLALSDPESYRGIVGGFARSSALRSAGPAQDAMEELTRLVEEVARSVNR